jgi:hypothetical protein
LPSSFSSSSFLSPNNKIEDIRQNDSKKKARIPISLQFIKNNKKNKEESNDEDIEEDNEENETENVKDLSQEISSELISTQFPKITTAQDTLLFDQLKNQKISHYSYLITSPVLKAAAIDYMSSMVEALYCQSFSKQCIKKQLLK